MFPVNTPFQANVNLHCLHGRPLCGKLKTEKMKEVFKVLGDNIKTYRKNKGYSQETLAQELFVVRQTISKWEKGVSQS